MPRLEEAQSLLPSSEDVKQRTKRTWDEFSDFALRDNVLEVAVGLMYLPNDPRLELRVSETNWTDSHQRSQQL